MKKGERRGFPTIGRRRLQNYLKTALRKSFSLRLKKGWNYRIRATRSHQPKTTAGSEGEVEENPAARKNMKGGLSTLQKKTK